MKRIIYTVFFIFLGVWSVAGQTTTENYVKTSVYQNESATDKIESINYFDGLGRPKQQVLVGQSPNGRDIITPVEYDDYGRQDKEYLPFEGRTTTGAYNAGALNDVIDFYDVTKFQDTENPYSQKGFEASPLNRVLKQAAPGSDWALGSGHEIEFEYLANTSEDGVVLFEVEFTNDDKSLPTLVKNDDYPEGELYKNITKDENHSGTGSDHTTEEFTNKQGQVVLKRTYESEVTHDTYYVYDDYGNLTYVLPPNVTTASVSREELEELCYQYKYDHRNRLVEKQIPGKKVEYIIYNTLDQPILTQDALLRDKKQWLFTKYDAFGRVVYTGIFTDAAGREREPLQEVILTETTLFEKTSTTRLTVGGGTIYYSNAVYPRSSVEVLTINYYDDYRFTSKPGAPTSVFSEPVSNATKGLVTGREVRVLETNNWISSYLLYDKKGRAIYAYNDNIYLNAIDEVSTEYDFIGKVLKTRASHTKDNNEAIVTQDVFTYDHANRLVDQHQCIGDSTLSENCGKKLDNDYEDLIELSDPITRSTTEIANTSVTLREGFEVKSTTSLTFTARITDQGGESGGASELIAHNTYDNIGQLESKKVGNSTTSPLQTVDYTYNVRGWLNTINDVTNLDDDLFSFKLGYNEGNNALYNGNIANTQWQTANDAVNTALTNKVKQYSYRYDALNRLTTSLLPVVTHDFGVIYEEYLDYDKNGNITLLFRSGEDGNTLDHLTYEYGDEESGIGNKLFAVSDRGDRDEGFKDGNTSGDDYTYDDNGNMIADANKGITSIEYNYLNLPTVIEFDTGESIEYIYEATGTKLRKEVSSGKTTDYAGNFIYEENDLKFANHPEGYIEPVNGTDASEGFVYVYQYKDHLGNIRLSYADDNDDGSVDVNEIREEKNYYPFGLQLKGFNADKRGRVHNYGFGGKEENDELGLEWIDITARNYDPALGRWMNLDPLAEQMRRHSPYNYGFDNPIYFQDPDGMMPFGPPISGEGIVRAFHTTINNFNSAVSDFFSPLFSIGSTNINNTTEVSSSDGFDFEDDSGVPKGDQSLKQKTTGNVTKVNVQGVMQLAGFTKLKSEGSRKVGPHPKNIVEKEKNIAETMKSGMNDGKKLSNQTTGTTEKIVKVGTIANEVVNGDTSKDTTNTTTASHDGFKVTKFFENRNEAEKDSLEQTKNPEVSKIVIEDF